MVIKAQRTLLENIERDQRTLRENIEREREREREREGCREHAVNM